jgi:hypothetical protein
MSKDTPEHPLTTPPFRAAYEVMKDWLPSHACDEIAFTWALSSAVEAALAAKEQQP